MVTLYWEELADFRDIFEILVLRSDETQDNPFVLTRRPFGESETHYVDSTALNGVTYYYHLGLVLDGNRTRHRVTEAIPATPGRHRCWVAAADGREVVVVSPDGRERQSQIRDFSSPWDIEIDSARDRVWITDVNAGQVSVFTTDSNLLARFRGYALPLGIAIMSDGSCLLADALDERVYRFSAELDSRVELLSPEDVSFPTELGVSPLDGTIWVCEQNPPELSHWTVEGAFLNAVTSMTKPERIAFSNDGSVWVTDSGANMLWHLDSSGDVLKKIPTGSFPYGLAVENRRELCWVAQIHAREVTAFNAAGVEVVAIDGLKGPFSVFVTESSLPHENACWVADTYGNRVYKFDLDGSFVGAAAGIGSPSFLAVETVKGER
jgi:DNA-binding beta-propeller fold protein YncE